MDTWSGFRGEDLIDMSFERMADEYERTLKAAGLLYMLTKDGADNETLANLGKNGRLMSSRNYDDCMTLKRQRVGHCCTRSACRTCRVYRCPVVPHHGCMRSARHACGLLFYPQPQLYDYYAQPYEYYGQQLVFAKYQAQPMYHGYGSRREGHVHQEEQPPPPPPLPNRWLTRGGGLTGGDNLPLKKEEDAAVAYADREAKPEEEQEAVPYGGAPEPEAKPEDEQEHAYPRERPPARGEPCLTQKGPEADVATGGGTGCGCVVSHAFCRSACRALMWL